MISLAEGSLFAGRYRVVRCIAAGGMGAVYEVIHPETERRRALKVMHPHLVQSQDLRERFKREAKVASQIDSEFIVDVFDAGIDDATQMPFLVMELLRGEELGDRLTREGRLPPYEAIDFLWQTALALDKTHRASIVHRDLKPENLFLTLREDGSRRIKVLDFGVAKFVAETGAADGGTRALGTPLYMAPEQFRGEPVSAATDVYALGMMAYTLLVGTRYWEAESRTAPNIVAFALKAQLGAVESASARAQQHGVTLPPGFDAWFARVTATDPKTRVAVATEAIRALGAVYGVDPGASPSQQRQSFSATPPTPAQSGTVRVPTAAGVSHASAPLSRTLDTPARPKSRLPLGLAAAAAVGAAAAGLYVLGTRSSTAAATAKPEVSVATAASTMTSTPATATASDAQTATPPPAAVPEPSSSATTSGSAVLAGPGRLSPLPPRPAVTAAASLPPPPATQPRPTPTYSRD